MTTKSSIRIGSFELTSWRFHFALLLLSAIVSLFIYGDAITWSRKQVFQAYLTVTGAPLNYYITVDQDGIPYSVDKTIGRQRNNVTVCNTALEYLEKIKRGDDSQQRYFLNCADWLVANRVFRNDTTSVLEYHYDWPIYEMKNPWQSGMAQGLSLQVLIGAHELTKDEKYLKAAKEQLNSFYLTVEENGVTYKSPQGWWYEEFADHDGKQSYVLNGMIFALLGLHDYYQYTKSESAKFLFEQGTMAVKLNLPKYDKFHIDLLQKLFARSGEPVFKEYADRWAKYSDPSVIVRVFRGEMKMMYVAYFLVNAALLFLVFEVAFVLFLISKRILK